MAQSIDPPVHQFMFQTETQVPNVALLNRFGDYSVDLANGLVDISIPLHTVRGRQLSLPITMRFHASGLRASDYEGPIGLGWALDAGGHISRTMRGYPDEMLPFVQDLGPNTEPEFKTLFGRTLKGDINGQNSGYNLEFYVDPYSPSTRGEYRDTEYDIFTYCLPNGKSGKFILEDVNGVKIPFTIPYEPVKIDMRKSSSGSGYGTFWITDEDGTKYRFGKYTDTDTRQAIDFNLGENFQQYASTWYLTSITSADGQDVIQLNYERDGVAARAGRESNTVEITDNYRTLTSHTLEPVGTLSMYDILEEQ